MDGLEYPLGAEEHSQARLDWETVRYIRNSTESARSIARRLGVVHGTVGAARRNETRHERKNPRLRGRIGRTMRLDGDMEAHHA